MHLRTKFTLVILGFSLLVGIYLVSYWFPNSQQQQIEGLQVEVSNQVDMLAESLVPLLLQNRLGSIHEALDEFMRKREEWLRVVLMDSEQRVLFPLEEISQIIENNSQQMSFSKPIVFHGEVLGELDVLVESSPLFERIYRINRQLALFLGSALMIAVIATLIVLDKIVRRPVGELLEAVNSLRGGDFAASLPKPGNDEIGGLVKGFTAMRNEILQGRRQLECARDNLENKVEERTVQLRKATEEALSATRAKSEFLSSMSHELRTPLNAVLGFGQLLDMKFSKTSDIETQENIRDILAGGHHLLNLINEVLDLSRIEAGRLMISPQPIALHQAITECISQIDIGMCRENNIVIINEVSDQDIEVVADPMRFKQVFINLLSNAVKYNKEGGSVTIKTDSLDNDRIRISITDAGNGIAAADMGKLFEPFERLSYKSSNIEGTGIGLTVTKQLVEAMDGSIGVESRVGEGSTFMVDLPLNTGIKRDEVSKMPPLKD